MHSTVVLADFIFDVCTETISQWVKQVISITSIVLNLGLMHINSKYSPSSTIVEGQGLLVERLLASAFGKSVFELRHYFEKVSKYVSRSGHIAFFMR